MDKAVYLIVAAFASLLLSFLVSLPVFRGLKSGKDDGKIGIWFMAHTVLGVLTMAGVYFLAGKALDDARITALLIVAVAWTVPAGLMAFAAWRARNNKEG